MSSVFDIGSVQVDTHPEVVLGVVPTNIDIEMETDVTNIEIVDNTDVEVVEVQVPGPQGPPGLKNVYIQENDPSVEYDWGMEQAGYVWIQL